MQPGLNRKITIGFALPVVIILAWRSSPTSARRNSSVAGERVAHSNQVLSELEGAVSDITEAESGVRGFLLTGDEVYLQSWRSGAQEAPQHLHRLLELTADDPVQQARVAELELASREKLAWVAQTVEVYKSQGPQAAKAIVMTGKGRVQMDRIRQIASGVEAQENQVLRSQTERAELKTRRATTYLRILAAVVVFVLGLAFYRVRTEMREVARVQRELADSQNKLHELLLREQELSRSDPLTQVANRRAFFEAVEVESRRARRYHRPLSVAYVDVDNFKNFNDSLGHAAGDTLLVTVAYIMQRSVRAGSCVARFGGDEFALMIPDVAATEVELTLHRIRRLLLEEMQTRGWPVTFSIGAAVFSEPRESGEEMVHLADQEMYAVKNRSKNDVSVISVRTKPEGRPLDTVVKGA